MSDENAQAQVPVEILRLLAPHAEAMGVHLPGFSRFVPTIDLAQDIRPLASQLGQAIKQRDIYIKEDELVEVDTKTGKEKTMTAKAFIGWVEEYITFRSPSTSRRIRNSLTKEEAEIILGQKVFRDCLRPLTAVHTMRLPVRRASGKVEFLEPGYDEESGILTCDLLKYPMDWDLEKGLEWLKDVCKGYAWNDIEDQKGDLAQNRSFAVHVMAMLGTYCRGMFAPGTLRPIIAYFANKPGTGKTTLVAMALAMLFGDVGATTAPKDEEKLSLKLEAVARSLRPYALLDDLAGGLRSQALNNFITARRHHGRKYHSQDFFDVPNVTQVFVTANDMATSEDIGRRSLLVNLFLYDQVRGRKFDRTITGAWLARPDIRSNFLAACCALLRNWLAHCEIAKQEVLHPSPLETFEDYTGPLGAMVCCAGLANPLDTPETDVGGASQQDEIRQLLIEVASAKEEDAFTAEHNITRKEMVDMAREHGLLEGLVGSKGDGDLDMTDTKRFGLRMRRWRGERIKDKHGRTFQFGHKKKNSGAVYPLVFIAPAPVIATDTGEAHDH